MWYIRHSPAIDPGICVGQFPIQVEHQPAEITQSLIQSAPITPKRIHSSDLPRCSELAAKLSTIWDIPLLIDDRLREISMGLWEGRSYENIQQAEPDAWDEWCQNWLSLAPPGGENLKVFADRVHSWYKTQAKNVFEPRSTELLIAHAGVIRALHAASGLEWKNAMEIKVPHLEWKKLTQQ